MTRLSPSGVPVVATPRPLPASSLRKARGSACSPCCPGPPSPSSPDIFRASAGGKRRPGTRAIFCAGWTPPSPRRPGGPPIAVCASWPSTSPRRSPARTRRQSPSGSVVARDTRSSGKDGTSARWGDPPSARPSGAAGPGSADSGWARVLLCSPQRSKLTIERQRSVLFPGDPTGESAGANVDGGPRGVRNLRAGSRPPLTPDQDNGYYSLEEEHGLKGHKGHVGALCDTREKPLDRGIRDGLSEKMADGRATEDAVPDETAAHSAPDEVETAAHVMREETTPAETAGHETAAAHATRDRPPDATVPPQCRNVSIAFIMGCPCSDDDSQSDADSVRADDGFDSSALSDLSSVLSSSDEEGDDADEETARLLASLNRRNDPYNPQNFSARLRTGHAPPALSPPASSPPPSGRDARADSGGEADEVESLLALASLTPRDPYSLLNFRAPLCTGKAPAATPPRSGRPPRTGRRLLATFHLCQKGPFQRRGGGVCDRAERRRRRGGGPPGAVGGAGPRPRPFPAALPGGGAQPGVLPAARTSAPGVPTRPRPRRRGSVSSSKRTLTFDAKLNGALFGILCS
ncbi:uncharacterized protein LOC133408541 [Phycodurus eques]|uniref:uncharacterized protein LOC133408541 n=1 Tax=Phycodurus eques TaxID=693459 RepID=UPI002ACE377B|nr:uncharacterized protein LOC133408541 [Phycodurus eques]